MKQENNYNENNNLTRFQLRAARAALNLTQEEISRLLNIPKSIINYLEIQSNASFINSTKKNIDESVFRDFFLKNNIIFPDSFTLTLI